MNLIAQLIAAASSLLNARGEPSPFVNAEGYHININDGIFNGTIRRKAYGGKPRTDLSAWPDGSLRWRPYDPSTAKAKRNINNERSLRRAMRMATR